MTKSKAFRGKISILIHRPCCPTGRPYSLIRLLSVEN
ncbi:TPA: triosephosphate isomerase [Enterobacter hormaechei]|uniref:Triosephosphate isomerase n=1 Tax=Enterobacter hormaechei TaxID=158836 RepID=A0A6L3Y2E9_9ENTR|nr:triosephosphate isomerase [Enterobacter cloacae complex sp.]AWV74069.1 triosephosphate isomerase [Enterobacter hormaechei subsp. xiangfangensis]AXO42680.1 triosephosphate isomerase [Enterobacter hormaechei]PLP51821.1 triosephosphate isomerase [Enterobacter cloacae complex sp. TREC1]PNY63829.1 triosephosphate isomerase [Enterobacter cloacae]POU32568.1 triosephosphate isomerase [Enterobacter cloacae complex sp. ECNIH8]POV13314.1 triosephosphate isomerase [Enterobacter cloacae complex sp. ECN